jgi:hypothetical protein
MEVSTNDIECVSLMGAQFGILIEYNPSEDGRKDGTWIVYHDGEELTRDHTWEEIISFIIGWMDSHRLRKSERPGWSS